MTVAVMILAFALMILFTAPVAFAIGVAATIGLALAGSAPLMVVPQRMFAGADSFVLLAIPLFILAGALMETGGISARLVNLARVAVGHVRGGLGMVVVFAEMLFSGISGSTVADVSAIGALMVPSLTRAGFKPDRAVAIVSAASAMGILIPPCLLMVIIAQIAGLSVGALFLAGFIPAVVLALAIVALIHIQAVRDRIPGEPRASWPMIRRAIKEALIPLAMLVLALLSTVQAALGTGLPRFAVATGVLGLMSAPLWLAPVAYLAGSAQPVSDWIVWLSPTTQLAAAASCDVLRLDFLYRYSLLATLHWSYPPVVASIVGWFSVAALGHGLSCLAFHGRGRTGGLTCLTLLQEPNR